MPLPTRSLLASSLFGAALLAACTMPVDESVGGTEGAQSGAESVRLRYEGTCEFLRTCSRFSRGMPEGQVSWGCTGAGTCEDTALWVAGPGRSYCNKTVRICRGSRCTNALVKDVSSDRVWEGSNGVLDALGIRYGLTGQCSGYGEGNVTVRVLRSEGGGGPTEGPLVAEPSGGTTSGDLPLPPPPPPPPEEPSSSSSGSSGKPPPAGGGRKDPGWSDAGCTLSNGDYVPDLGCVWSTDGSWYQCTMGTWARGGNGSYGPYGACTAVYGL